MNKKRISIIMILAAVLVLTACGADNNENGAANTNTNTQVSTVPEQSKEPEATPQAEDNEGKRPEDIYRFETTALYGEGGETINPNGMLLNIGCEDCQDIFYASKSLTVAEVIEKLKSDFGVEEMIFDENFVRFDLGLEEIKRLEQELDLIAAKKMAEGGEIFNIRIISIKPVEEPES